MPDESSSYSNGSGRVGVFLPPPPDAVNERELLTETFTFTLTVSRTFRDFGKSYELSVVNRSTPSNAVLSAPVLTPL